VAFRQEHTRVEASHSSRFASLVEVAGENMTYHWYARYRLAQLMRQLADHRALCADCLGRFPCVTREQLKYKVKHYQKVHAA